MSKKHRHKKKQPHINTKRIEKKAANPPREKTRKEVVVWEATGIIMLVLAFVSIIIPAILSDSEGHLECGWDTEHEKTLRYPQKSKTWAQSAKRSPLYPRNKKEHRGHWTFQKFCILK